MIYTKEFLKDYFKDHPADQCLSGLSFLLTKFKELNPSIYMEIGCAKLNTFHLFHSLLPKEGLALGLDIRKYSEWELYNKENLCDFILSDQGSGNNEAFTKFCNSLNKREIDFLFIDGNHYEEFVQMDWDMYSPLVRKGGIIAFHDWDPPSVARGFLAGQGAAIVTNKLKKDYQILSVPNTSIGTAYLYKK